MHIQMPRLNLRKRFIMITCLICALHTQTVKCGQNEKIPITVPEGQDYIVVDQLDGVEAKYREGSGNDITGIYSCAGYVAAYFRQVYGISINNLIDTGPPQPAALLERVSVPQKGDLIFTPSPPSQNNHSAIVKSFDGNQITLIEQNYKWVTDGVTYVTVNRTIPYPSDDYEIWRSRNAPVSGSPQAYEGAATDTPVDEHALMQLLSFQYNTDITVDSGLHFVDSVFFDIGVLSGDKVYRFTVPDEFDLCVYALASEGSPTAYRLAGPGETVTAADAVFRRPIQAVFASTQAPPAKQRVVVTVNSLSMDVNGEPTAIDAPAFLQSGRIMLPVKWVATALQIDSENLFWNQETKTVTIFAQDKLIHFAVNSDLLFVDGTAVRMDCPAVIKNDRAYLPVKYLADALGVAYAWDGDAQAVTFQ